ncbi:MAG: DNA-(apurinic or apyrimidinic site) lyase / endonuclease [Acidobacteria bacterium]|nr:DNA-(apurinic or apyrimidinic site) lyase / endonuclease [Acidobacteriota bacterium]
MPEGDTIFRAARTLHRALAGKRVAKFETAFAQLARIDDESPIAGRTIERVRAAGKHLIIDFSGDLSLRTHMRMNGSWHIYKTGERWQRPRGDMRVVVATDDYVAVGFNVPIAELEPTETVDKLDLGPDFLADTFDAAEAVRRIRERGNEEIADVLLNQRVVAGIGNVFKSEVLFLAKVNPFRVVADLTDDELTSILKLGRRLMQQNVRPGTRERRTTDRAHPAEGLWVYSRGSEPCRKCGTPIQYRKQGRDVRGTYWCPKCQPASPR